MYVYSNDETQTEPIETVGDVVKTETARQAVILVFSLAGVWVSYKILRYVESPADWTEFKMRWALRVRRVAQWNVDRWQTVADKAATVYNRERG